MRALGIVLALSCAGCLVDTPSHGDGPAKQVADLALGGDLAGQAGDDLQNGDGAVSNDLASGTGVWVAVGYGGRRMRSLDNAATWIDDVSLEPNGADDNDNLRTIAFGDGKFVAIGFHVMTSPDGKTWTDLGTSPITNWVGGLVWADGEFVAAGGYGLRETSPDGVTWTSHSIDTNAAHAQDGVAYGGGTFVMATDAGVRSYSTDGKTWNATTGAGTATTELAYGAGVFVAIGGTASLVSTDGIAWTSTGTFSSSVQGLVFAQGHFTAMGQGHVYTSTDGSTWTDHTVGAAANGNLSYGNGVYVQIGWTSYRTSTDGVTWGNYVSTGSDNSLNYAVFGEI